MKKGLAGGCEFCGFCARRFDSGEGIFRNEQGQPFCEGHENGGVLWKEQKDRISELEDVITKADSALQAVTRRNSRIRIHIKEIFSDGVYTEEISIVDRLLRLLTISEETDSKVSEAGDILDQM